MELCLDRKNFTRFICAPIALAVINLFSAQSLSRSIDCASYNSNQEVIACLNTQAKNLFHKGGSQSLEAQFYIDFLALTEAQKLKLREAPSSLSNSFQIEIPRTKDLLDMDSPSCFNFEPGWTERALGVSRQNRVQLISSQMQQSALFLKHLHLLSLGQESSVLFPVRRIEICSAPEKSYEYSHGILKLNLVESSSSSLFSARELFDLWTSGDLVFGPKPGFLDTMQSYFEKDAKTVLTEKMRSYWPLLNPTGELRFRLRVFLMNYINQVQTQIASQDPMSLIQARSVNLGLQTVAMTQDQALQVKSNWAEHLNDPNFISQLTEQALLQAQVGITQVTNIDHRRNIGLVNVKNNKQINVDIHGLFSEVYPFETVPQDRRLESHSLQVGLVNVDLIDQVNVNLSLPPGLPQWIENISLKKALQSLYLSCCLNNSCYRNASD